MTKTRAVKSLSHYRPNTPHQLPAPLLQEAFPSPGSGTLHGSHSPAPGIPATGCPPCQQDAAHPARTLVLLGGVVVVDLLADALALAQVAGQVLLLLLVVVPQQLLPVVGVHVLLLLDDLPFHLLLGARGRRR